ncbi:MAG: cation:proton antiporter [Gammaproteobacteria bacterium]|nr:cation:proton antiporter [Gammaproteobacteria bacterium]
MHLESFLTSALLLLIVTSIAVTLFKQFGLGSVLGLLVSGIIVGPYSPGPYITTHVDDIRHFTELGVVLLLFVIGLEMKPSRLWSMRRDVLGLGSLQITLTGVAIGIYLYFFQYSWPIALLIGLTFALSSTAFVLQLLQERGEIASKHGTTAFSVLLMQDMAIVPLLAIVPIMSVTGELSGVPLWKQFAIIVGTLVLIAGFGRYIVPWVLNHLVGQRNKEGFLLVVMLAVFLAAWAMHLSGASMVLGAFIMGVLLSDSRYRLQIQAAIEPYKGILMSLFFVTVGMSINIQALADQLAVFLQHTVVIVAIKVFVLFILVLAFGYTRGVAIRISLLLSQGGEFGFVLFGSAKALQVIDDGTFVIAIGVISVTMLLTPLIVRLGDNLARRLELEEVDTTLAFKELDAETSGKPVIIGGYGRVGHAVGIMLHSSGVPFIAFDTDPVKVKQGRDDMMPVYYGDIGDPELLAAAHAERASLVVLTIDHSPTALQAVSHIRTHFPQLPVIARARDLVDCANLTEAGATHAYPEAVESSLRLGGLALEMINIPEDQVDQLIEDVRSDNYQLVCPIPREEKDQG